MKKSDNKQLVSIATSATSTYMANAKEKITPFFDKLNTRLLLSQIMNITCSINSTPSHAII